MKKFGVLLILSVFLFSFTSVDNTTWSLDKAHAKLSFTITHLMVSDVEGQFKNFEATITGAKEDFTDAVVDMKADVNSINTDNDKRDEHLKSEDFFDVKKFPELTFKSTSFKKVDATNYKVVGNLTLHGVTKSIELNAVARLGTNPMSKKPVAGFKLTGSLKRTDFKIGEKMPSAMLSDDVAIVANAEFGKN